MQNVCYLKKDTERLRKFYRTVNIVLLSIISLKICLSGKTHKEFCFQEKYKNEIKIINLSVASKRDIMEKINY